MTCVRGDDDAALAAAWGCDEAAAAAGRAAMLAFLRELVRPGLPAERGGVTCHWTGRWFVGRYAGGARIPTVAGGKTLEITGADESAASTSGTPCGATPCRASTSSGRSRSSRRTG